MTHRSVYKLVATNRRNTSLQQIASCSVQSGDKSRELWTRQCILLLRHVAKMFTRCAKSDDDIFWSLSPRYRSHMLRRQTSQCRGDKLFTKILLFTRRNLSLRRVAAICRPVCTDLKPIFH